jgi:hypothetical protein
MTEDEWYATYKPIKNHLDKNASWNGEMFETYGEEVEFVISSVPWTEEAMSITIDEADENCYACGENLEDGDCECELGAVRV